MCPVWGSGYRVTWWEGRYAVVERGQSLRVRWGSSGSQPKRGIHEWKCGGLPEGRTAGECFQADQDNYPAGISSVEVYLLLGHAKNGEVEG
jgi:hypothetical protein